MDDDEKKKPDQFNAALPLPGHGQKSDDGQPNPAAELIRKKVAAAYDQEPDYSEEVDEIEDISPKSKHSKHQQFIYELTNSGQPLHEVQTAWHEYYAGLTDAEKHGVWQEFYNTHAQAAQHPALSHQQRSQHPVRPRTKLSASRIAKKTGQKLGPKPQLKRASRGRPKQANPIHSIMFGLGAGSIVVVVFMFSFFNERIIAPFIQPSLNVTNIPIIGDVAVGSNPEIVIPKINAEIPVVYDVTSNKDKDIQKGLERGVVHYADTAMPGENGNVVIVGHSSGNVFNLGNYKFAFSLLRAMDNGDTFFLQKDGKRYVYQVYDKKIVKPTDVSVLGPAAKNASATLITCDPPGLNSHRLVITAEQINPDPTQNTKTAAKYQLSSSAALIPGNSQSLWARMVEWFTH
jgi:LPXTG-site transpeptidase (sortase) family protein